MYELLTSRCYCFCSSFEACRHPRPGSIQIPTSSPTSFPSHQLHHSHSHITTTTILNPHIIKQTKCVSQSHFSSSLSGLRLSSPHRLIQPTLPSPSPPRPKGQSTSLSPTRPHPASPQTQPSQTRLQMPRHRSHPKSPLTTRRELPPRMSPGSVFWLGAFVFSLSSESEPDLLCALVCYIPQTLDLLRFLEERLKKKKESWAITE
ncbi:uncharacterized protein V1513DRAFT_444421 [Lipomyces chichibuensis]|uniref:uncharacterized protein n=1 Tax=Lipomyces chichibuensis TaxID=1546026 RepID=UPI0033431D58